MWEENVVGECGYSRQVFWYGYELPKLAGGLDVCQGKERFERLGRYVVEVDRRSDFLP